MKDKKEYLFWRDVRKHIREECIIEAESMEKAVSLHNEGMTEYEEVDCFFDDVMDEGSEECTL